MHAAHTSGCLHRVDTRQECGHLAASAAAAPRGAAPAPRRLRCCRIRSRVAAAAMTSMVSEEEQPSPEKQALITATRRIRDLGNARDAVGAVAALAELGASGVTPDLRAVTTTLSACIQADDLPRAQRVFDDLVEAGVVVPDELLFSVLLRAHGAKSPPLWSDISKLLGQMKHTFGVSPTAITYNVLLEVCAVTNDYDRGCQLIDRMVEEGVEPNAFTLAAVATRKSLRSYLKRGM